MVLADPLHDSSNNLIGPYLDAAFQTLAQQSLNGQLPLDWRRQLQTKSQNLQPLSKQSLCLELNLVNQSSMRI